MGYNIRVSELKYRVLGVALGVKAVLLVCRRVTEKARKFSERLQEGHFTFAALISS